MFERFTTRARLVVVLAQEEARLLHHPHIDTEHLLLGLLKEADGFAADALSAFDLTLDATRRLVEEMAGKGENEPVGGLRFTPRAKKVLSLSLREALSLRSHYIGTEHLLLGLIREGEGLAVQVLAQSGVDLAALRAELLKTLKSRLGDLPPRSEEGPPLPAPMRLIPYAEKLDRVLDSLARIERRLDAMGAPPDPGLDDSQPEDPDLDAPDVEAR